MRPAKPDDFLRIADIRNAALAATSRSELRLGWRPESVVNYLSYPGADQSRDLMVADAPELTDGPAGFSLVHPSTLRDDGGGRVLELWELAVNPFLWRRGVGRALLVRVVADAAERGFSAVRTSWLPESRVAAKEMLTREGFRVVRQYKRLRRALSRLPAAPEPPEGHRIEPGMGPADEFCRLYNRATSDLWGVERLTPETLCFQTPATAQLVRIDLSMLDETGRRLAFIVAYIDREHGEMIIDAVGVDRADRRRGLGFAMAAAACERARERGARSVALWVDSENKAALGLYEALSFELAGREHVFERRVSAGAAPG